MPQQPNSGWTPVDDSTSGWTPVEEPTAPETKTPGFFKRLAQGVGVPSSAEEVKALQPSTTEKIVSAVAPGAGMVPKLAYQYGKALIGAGKTLGRESFEAGENVAAGGPVGANIGKVGAATTESLLKGVFGPVGGGALQAWGEDVQANNYLGAAGDALAVITNALLLKGSRSLGKTGKVEKLSFAGDFPKSIHPDEVRGILPDLAKAAPEGAPKTIGDLFQNIKQAKTNINSEVGQTMFKLRGKHFSAHPIAQAIRSHITPDLAMTAEGQARAKALNAAATEYEKPWTAEQLHHQRVTKNAELTNFYKKGSMGQYGDLKTNVGVIVDKEVADTIRDIMYPEMDKAVGAPAGYHKNLLSRHSTLIELGKTTEEQATGLAMQSAKARGAPRRLRENVSLYQSHLGPPGVSAHKIQNIFLGPPDPLQAANMAVSRAFHGRPTAVAGVLSFPVRHLLLFDQEETPPPVQNRADALQLLGR